MFKYIAYICLIINSLYANDFILSDVIEKECKYVSTQNLLNISIIDKEEEINDVIFLNLNKKLFNQQNICLVTKKYNSHFNKNIYENKKIKLLSSFNKNDYVEYIFDVKCKDLTKEDLINSYVLRTNEDNRSLIYSPLFTTTGRYTSTETKCSITKFNQ